MLSIMFLFGPDGTRLQVFDVFSPLPVVGGGSSQMCCSSSLTSTSLPSFVVLCLFLPEFWASSKLCTLRVGTGTFAEVTVFRDVGFFLELLSLCEVLVLKGPSFPLKSDFLSIEATCLLICGTFLSHSTFTKPKQYDAAWLIKM